MVMLMLLASSRIAGQAPLVKEWLDQKSTEKEYGESQVLLLTSLNGLLVSGYRHQGSGLQQISDSSWQEFYSYQHQFQADETPDGAIIRYEHVLESPMNENLSWLGWPSLLDKMKSTGFFSSVEQQEADSLFRALTADLRLRLKVLRQSAVTGIQLMDDAGRLHQISWTYQRIQSDCETATILFQQIGRQFINRLQTSRELKQINRMYGMDE
jgi:hypothetical protein